MSAADALCKALPNCQGVVVVEGAAHASNLSHPEQVNGPLREFLAKHA
jgi:pimeloyl-ACP methyl ester carboxylesterase